MTAFIRASEWSRRLGSAALCFVSLVALMPSAGAAVDPNDPAIKPYLVATEPKKFALLIGGDTYDHLTRINSIDGDLGTLRNALVSVGFDVYVPDLKNRTQAVLLQELAALVARVKNTAPDGNALVLIFFGGHGFTFDTAGYLAPKDFDVAAMQAGVANEHRLPTDFAISVDYLIETLRRTNAQGTILLVDACRGDPGTLPTAPTDPATPDAPATPPATPAAPAPAPPVAAPGVVLGQTITTKAWPAWPGRDTYVLFSTQPYTTAYSPPGQGGLSVFVDELARSIGLLPTRPFDALVRRTTNAVNDRTRDTAYAQKPHGSPGGSGGFPLQWDPDKTEEPEDWLNAVATRNVCTIREFQYQYPVTRYWNALRQWQADWSVANQGQEVDAYCASMPAAPNEYVAIVSDVVAAQGSEETRLVAQAVGRTRVFSDVLLTRSTRFTVPTEQLIIKGSGKISEITIPDRTTSYVRTDKVFVPPTLQREYWTAGRVTQLPDPASATPGVAAGQSFVLPENCLEAVRTNSACPELDQFVASARAERRTLQILSVLDDRESDERGTSRQRAYRDAVAVQLAAETSDSRIFVQPKSLHPDLAGRVALKIAPR